MQIKLSTYNLVYSSKITIRYGMQVCPSNGATSVGTVVGMSTEQHPNSYYIHAPARVTILWGTGKKRGKRTDHPPENLTDFTRYMAAVKAEYDSLAKLESEAKSVGM